MLLVLLEHTSNNFFLPSLDQYRILFLRHRTRSIMTTDLVVDEGTFVQLLEIDDYEFAKGIIDEYFQQAENLTEQFDLLLAQQKWSEVAKLGHHLKGSSAAVGAANVRDICDKIQHYETTKVRNPATYLKQEVVLLKAAIPVAKAALGERLIQASH